MNRRTAIGILAAAAVIPGAAGAVPPPPPPRLRRRFDSLSNSDEDYAAFAEGWKEMGKRSDKYSLDHLVAIHRASARHGSWLFFPWHRLQLRHFESVIARLTGHSTFALPYWDYAGEHHLPARLTWDQSPFFHAGRTAAPGLDFAQTRWGMNQGAANLLRDGFETFVGEPEAAGRVEAYGHNLVHTLTGGDMARLGTAPLDPVFWLHHCNVDRVFATWQKLEARTYPEEWAQSKIGGFGKKIDTDVAALIRTETLGYGYDELYPYPNFSVGVTPPAGRSVREKVKERTYSGRASVAPGASSMEVVLDEEALAAIRADVGQFLDIEGKGVVAFAADGLESQIVKVIASTGDEGRARPIILSASSALLMDMGMGGHHHPYAHCLTFGANISNLIGRSRGPIVLRAFTEPGVPGVPAGRAQAVSLDYRLTLTTNRWV